MFGKRLYNLHEVAKLAQWMAEVKWEPSSTSDLQPSCCNVPFSCTPIFLGFPAAFYRCGLVGIDALRLHLLDCSLSGLWQSASLPMFLKISMGVGGFLVKFNPDPSYFAFIMLCDTIMPILNNKISASERLSRSCRPNLNNVRRPIPESPTHPEPSVWMPRGWRTC